MNGRYKAFQGANGWYVAFERDDGFHTQPPLPRWLERNEAAREAKRLNEESDEEGAR